jgi:hypothetical protein
MIDKRKAYEEKLAAQLEEWNALVALSKAKADKATAAAKIELCEITETLQRKQDEARAKLQELQDAGDDAWEALKKGAESAWSEIHDAFHSAAAKFK